jgi:23S rRNA pseudoU1915 N3-methylase RlmH
MNFEQNPSSKGAQEKPFSPQEKQETSPEKQLLVSREILDIDESTFINLRERIRGNQGHVQVCMHPYFGRHHGTGMNGLEVGVQTEEGQNSRQQAFVEEGFLRIAKQAMENPHSAPLIIFEEESYMLDSKTRLATELELQAEDFASRGIVFVPTVYDAGMISYDRATEVYDQVHGTNTHSVYQKLSLLERSIIANTRADVMQITTTSRTREELDERRSALVAQVSPILERVKGSIGSLRNVSEKILLDLVQGLEISSVNLSGGFFRKETKAKKEYYLMSGGCAGYLRNQLRHQNVKVNLSRYVAPKRESIGKLDLITKDTRDFVE